MKFAELQARLRADLLCRLRNGEWTERGLARYVGVSQPHMHNVLSGVRLLTPDLADSILAHLGLDLLSLLRREELARALQELDLAGGYFRAVPLAEGTLGPGAPWPDLASRPELVSLEAHFLGDTVRPVLVRLSDDPGLEPGWNGGDVALLEPLSPAHGAVENGDWCALRVGGRGFVRQVRMAAGSLVVRRQMALLREAEDGLDGGVGLQSVKARVLWVGPDPRGTRTLDQAGFLKRPATSR